MRGSGAADLEHDGDAGMSLALRLAMVGDLRAASERYKIAILGGERDARDQFGTRLKLRLRDDIRAAGLGDRMANTVRYEGYPEGNRLAWKPAGLVFSKAPLIIEAFSADTTILPRKGLFLAIPTENVPRHGRPGGRGQSGRLSVQEVEAMYGQKLTLLPGGGKGLTGPGSQLNVLLGCVDKTFKKRQRRDRRRKQPRGVSPITQRPFLTVMFVFVRMVHLRQRLNWFRIKAQGLAEWESILRDNVAHRLLAA
jgi:Family of unknown function (DUF6441)